jgi:protein-disulfide isomerase
MLFARRLCMALTALMLALCTPALAAPKPFLGPEVDMGNPKAQVTVIEYGSASCPHCAHFNNDVFPAFKAKYIDTGKVHYVFRELLTQPVDFAASGFLTARCAGRDKYFAVLDAIFHDQAQIYQSGDMLGGLQAIGQRFGLSKPDLDACIRDPEAQKALQDRVAAANKDGVDSTPTFLINGQRLEGDNTLGDLMLVIEPLLARIAAGGH